MTKRFIIYLFTILLAVSCSKEAIVHYTINGHTDYTESDIMLFGLDRRFPKIETIKTDEQGNFSYTIANDTIVPFIMVMPDGKQITLFAEQGVMAELSYDSTALKYRIANGGPTQVLHDSISNAIEACLTKKKQVETIEEFITKHPVNEASIALLREYMIEVPKPDYQQIKRFISILGGVLQDNEFLAITKNNIDKRNGNNLHKQFPSFTYFTADSCKELTPNSFNKKHVLVTFWASWDENSREQMKLLPEIDKAIKSENFDILNIALDHDSTEWKKCIDNDSIIGYNVFEKEAWSSEIASKFNIKSLPYSILLNPYQRIIKVDIDLKNDISAIDSIVTKHDKSVKEREKREKREKERKEKEKKKDKK